MTSERQRNKGYPIPDPPTTTDTICVSLRIPNDPIHIANFKGHLNLLTKWNWHEKSYLPDDRRARDVARMWHELIEETLCMSDCEEGKYARDITILNGYNTYINNLGDEYDGNTSSIAPTLVYTADGFNGNRDAALCYAIQGYVDELCTLTIDYIEDATSLTNTVATALAMLAGILAVPSLGLSLWLIIGVGAAGLGLQVLGGITLFAREVYENAEARKEVACEIYEALRGATLTEAGFEGSLVGHSLTGDAEKIADMMIPFMADTNQYLAFVMLTDQAFGLSKVGALLPCPCDCQYEWAFEDDDPLPHTIISGTRGDEAGRTGKGIKGATYTDSEQNGKMSKVQMDVECTVYNVSIDVKFGHGSANNNIGVVIQAYAAGDVLINTQPPSGVYSKAKNVWHTINVPIIAPDAEYIVVQVAFQNTIPAATDNKYVYLDNVKVNP